MYGGFTYVCLVVADVGIVLVRFAAGGEFDGITLNASVSTIYHSGVMLNPRGVVGFPFTRLGYNVMTLQEKQEGNVK